MQRMARLASWIALALLFGLAVWFRVTSLEAAPEVDGDEAWHAVQLTRMLRGQSFAIRTTHGLPLSPFHAALELPLLLAFRPSLWLPRVPTVTTGLLAVALAYVLGRRILDRPTALIASGLLAALPVAIIYSRTGYESSHAPLYTLLLIYCAFRLKVAAMSALLLCCYFVHPTNIFLLPALLGIILARSIGEGAWGSAEGRRRLAARLAVPTGIVLAIGLYTMRRPSVRAVADDTRRILLDYLHIASKHDPGQFLTFLGRMYLGLGLGPWTWRERAFWAIVPAVLVLGAAALIRGRQWERLALVGGVLLSVLACYAVGGIDMMCPGLGRYGLFLAVPSVLAFACLLRALAVAPTGGWRTSAHHLQVAGGLALAWGLLLGARPDRIKPSRVLGPSPIGRESAWTFRADVDAPQKQVIAAVARDLDRRGGRALVVAPGWHDHFVLTYLALPRRDIQVVPYDKLGTLPEHHRDLLRKQVLGGAYAVSRPGQEVEAALTSTFPADRLRRRETAGNGGRRMLIYQWDGPAVAAGIPAVGGPRRAR